MKRNRHLGIYACGNLAGCYDPQRALAIDDLLERSDRLAAKARNSVGEERQRLRIGSKILERAGCYLAGVRFDRPGLTTREFDEEATPFAVEHQQ